MTPWPGFCASKWDTAGLDSNNAFTTSLVLRTAGILARPIVRAGRGADAQAGLQGRGVPSGAAIQDNFRKFVNLTLPEIATLITQGMPESLSVQGYPPTSAIGYWLLDAISLLGINLDEHDSIPLVRWAVREFSRQVSLVSAGDHAGWTQ